MFQSVVDSVASVNTSPSTLSLSSVMGFSSSAAVLNPGRKSGNGTTPEHRRQVVRGPMVPMVGIAGKSPVAGVIVHAVSSGGWLHTVFALAGHRYAGKAVINDAPYFLQDEKQINLTRKTTAAGAYFVHNGNGINIAVYDGAQTSQAHIPTLQGVFSSDMIGKGLVLAHVHLQDHSGIFPDGFPEFSFLIDAGDGDSLSSDAILHYMRNDFEADDSELNLESFANARTICAQSVVTAAGANEHRYTCGGAYDFDESHADVLERLLQTCGGKLVYQHGQFSLFVATHYGDPVLELTEADMIGDVEITPMPERRDLANIIKGSYTDSLSGYQEADFPEVSSERFMLEDGEELEDDFDLEFVQSSDQAQRLASLELNRHRLLTLKASFNFKAFSAKVGRIIRLNTPSIGINLPFMVESWDFDTKKAVTLTLREDFAELWGDYIGAVPSRPPVTDLPGAGDIDPPENAQIAEFKQFGQWIAELSWSHPYPGSVRRYYVTVDHMKADGENWIADRVVTGETVEQRYRFSVPMDGQFRATITAENNFGIISEVYEYWYISSVPTITINEIIAETVDVTAYPARARLSWQVAGLDKFDPDTVLFTVETRPASGDWLPVTKTGATSCWVEGLANGRHEIRVKADPPFGMPTGWIVGSFEVRAITVPAQLTFTATAEDSTTAGVFSWTGAGQSFDVEMRKNGILWAGGSVSAREWQVPASEPGLYVLRVRARAGDEVSDFSELDWNAAALPAPLFMVFTVTPQNAASSAVLSWQSGGASQFTSGYELHLIDSANNIDLRTITQGTEFLLPVILPGAYTAKVRAVSITGEYFSPWAQDTGTIQGLAAPKDLTAVETIIGAGATLQQSIVVSWKPGDELSQSYELEYRLLSSDEWSGGYSGAATSATLTSLTPGDYYFRVRARLAGVASAHAQTLVNVQGLERAPENISGLKFSALSSTVAMLSWDLMNDPTVMTGGFIHVRHTHQTGAAATWEGAVPLTDRLPGNATLTNVPLLSGTYMMKAVNAFSQWSKTAAVVVSNISNMLNYNRVVERAEPTTWEGEKHEAVIEGTAITLQGHGAYYVMDEPLDMGAVFTARLTLQLDGSVYLPDLIDLRTDKMDEWAMFDGQDPGNTSLIYEVSQTDDNPASSSAQWSSWTQFLVGEFRARAFRLRVSLITDDPNAVGTIAALKLIADVPDRTERGLGVASPSGGIAVKYVTAFIAPAVIAITGQGMSSGDRYEITNSNSEGFTIRFYNSGGAGVARSFDFFAISHGEQ